MSTIIFVIIGCIIIVGVEVTMWKLFTRKVKGTVLPQKADQSALGILTVEKLRIFVVIHTLIMLAFFISTAIYAW